jgi:hypothetical protein
MEIMQFIITSLPTLNQGYDEKSKDSKFVCFCFFLFKYLFSRDANLKLQLLLLKTVEKVCVFFLIDLYDDNNNNHG